MGDNGDDWEVSCNDQSDYGPVKRVGDLITGKDSFYLKHVDTGCTLISDSNYRYTHANCPRCPIVGHNEVACVGNVRQKTALWTIDSGFFFPLREEAPESDENEEDSVNDEL